MFSLKEEIDKAEEKGVAIGHFNISTLEMFWGIVNAAREMDVPVIIGLSEGERDFVGVRQARTLVASARSEFNHPIFINADHSHSLERFREAVDAKYDMAIIDVAGEQFDENVAISKQAVEYAKENNPDTLVEAEIGYIGVSSKLLDEVPEGALIDKEALPKPEEARRFVAESGVDLLAPAVGNLHGMMKNAENPALDLKLISATREAAGVPLVLHGGSGISDSDMKSAVKAGISVIHVSTEIRIAYRQALEKSLADRPDELSPYKYLPDTVEAVKKVVLSKMRMFNST